MDEIAPWIAIANFFMARGFVDFSGGMSSNVARWDCYCSVACPNSSSNLFQTFLMRPWCSQQPFVWLRHSNQLEDVPLRRQNCCNNLRTIPWTRIWTSNNFQDCRWTLLPEVAAYALTICFNSGFAHCSTVSCKFFWSSVIKANCCAKSSVLLSSGMKESVLDLAVRFSSIFLENYIVISGKI